VYKDNANADDLCVIKFLNNMELHAAFWPQLSF